MAWVAVAVAGTTLVTGAMSADAQRSAGNKAADTQLAATDKGIAENQRQFDALQKLLSPYVTKGTQALDAQGNLIGLNGTAPQQAAINAIQNSPQFTAMTQQGENAILQNASATGGLRGGNTQAALAQFRPQVLAQLINDQYGRLGGLTSVGQNAAAGVGNAGMQTGQNISNLLQQGGAAQAGAYLNAGRAQQSMFGNIGSALGQYIGLGGKF
jgi:hypothetical protein